jgi:Secretion system C-terminal sorting domain
MKIKQLVTAILLITTQIASSLHAQNVDIQLRNTGATLEVWLIPKANYTGIVSNLTFAISWNTAYNVDLAAAGAETVHVPTIPIQVSGNATQTSMVNGTRKYRVYASGGGASSISLTNNAAFKIMSVPVPRTSTTLTGAFSISNDAFITDNFWNYYLEIGGNDYTGNTSSIATSVPIPLELIAFKAIEKDKVAYLTWKTASEIDFSHFDVQRSADAQNWTTISTVKGGNTEGGYSLTDADAFNKSATALYRLKMVNTDETFKYSQVQSIQRIDGFSSLKLYPNPAHNEIQITMDAANNGLQSVDIIDAMGKVWQHHVNSQNSQTLNVATLNSGVYFLQIIDNKGVKKTARFIKL